MDDRFSIGRWIRMNARWRPEQVAMQEGDFAVTYRELDGRVNRLANALAGKGVGFGDRVALLTPNRVETIEVVLAAASLGAIAVPLNYRLAPRELAFMLRDSGSRLMIWDEAFAGLADALRGRGEQVDSADRADEANEANEADEADEADEVEWIALGDDYEALLSDSTIEVPIAAEPILEDTPHLIMYTAGTTGQPKGVTLSHGNTFWQCLNAVSLGLMPEAIGLAALPFFHVGGLNGSVMPVLYIGGTVIIQRQFDPVGTLSLIERHGVQGMVGVPAIFQFLAALPQFETTDLTSVIAFTSGGAPLPLHTIEIYKKRGIVFRQGYGLTEAAPGVTGMEPQDAYEKPGSVGRACHHTEVRVIDAEGRPCAPGERGEVVVRGPNIMLGYWNRPDETAETLRDGWLRTGDAGQMDADGFLYVAGRIKEMIISGGENIYPAEVMNALCEHPAVAECQVIGAPDPKWGQRPVAFVALRPGQEATADRFSEFLEGRLARFKHPRDYHLLPFLPRNATGKVQDSELRKLLAGG